MQRDKEHILKNTYNIHFLYKESRNPVNPFVIVFVFVFFFTLIGVVVADAFVLNI